MTKYTRKEILENYSKQLDEANKGLEKLECYCGEDIKINGLNGWIFEQVVRHCLTEELNILGILNLHIKEQYKLELDGSEYGKKRHSAIIDLLIENKILVEIKGRGYKISGKNDSRDDDKLRYIKKKAEEQGLVYLYITREEAKEPKNKNSFNYRKTTREIIEGKNCFFLDEEKDDDWQKFVNRVCSLLKSKNID